MSELRENPDLMMEVLAKLVHREGGYIKVTKDDVPTGEFDLMSRIDMETGTVELKLSHDVGTA